jgi:hypothetical protein
MCVAPRRAIQAISKEKRTVALRTDYSFATLKTYTHSKTPNALGICNMCIKEKFTNSVLQKRSHCHQTTNKSAGEAGRKQLENNNALSNANMTSNNELHL